MKSKSTRIISLLLALVLLLALAACGSEPEQESTEAPATDAPQSTEAPSNEPEAQPDDSESHSQEPSGGEIAKYDYTLPLTTDEVIYTATVPVNPNAVQYFSDMNENLTWQVIQERTGVTIEFTSLPGNVIGEQYGIIVTTGEYPDAMCNLSSNYTGGASQALADGVIIDLMEHIDVMPNFWYFLNQDNDTLKSVKTDDGNILIIPNCYEGGNPSSNGVVFRSDWFEALELEVPETWDEYYDVLKAMSTEYGGGLWLMPCGDARYGEWSAGFGTSGFFATSPTAAYPLMVKDGTVHWGTAMEEYRDYVSTMAKWYSEGLIMQDFFTLSGWTITTDDLAKGGVSAFPTFAESVESQLAVAKEQNYEFVAAKFPVMNKGDTHHVSGDYGKTIRTNCTWCFTTNSEDIDLLLQVFDYRFSDEGAFLLNWGIEGETYEMVDGEPVYTELITNNSEGMTTQVTQSLYLTDVAAYPNFGTTFDATNYSDWTLSIRDGLWTENKDNEYALPDSVSLNAEETETVTPLLGDIMTLLSESAVKFITGELSAEEDFDNFLKQQEDMGVRTIEQVYQAAYDRYLQR